MRVAMSDHSKRRKAPRSSEHKFVVRHQQKQRLLLRALESMDTSSETRSESEAVSEMIVRLEELLARRQRIAVLGTKPPRKPRKRCTYGSEKTTRATV